MYTKIQKNPNLILFQIKQANNKILKILIKLMMKIGQQMKIIIVIKIKKVRMKILMERKIKINKFNKNLAANITFENAIKNVQNAKNSSLVGYVMI